MGSSTKRNATDSLTAIGYVRVSTDRQELGPEAQVAAITSWALAQGVTVAAWHVDQGVSGTADITARPGLLAAIADITVRRAGVLIVAKRDRLSRDPMNAMLLERMASTAGARIVSASGEGNGTTPGDAFLRGIIDLAAAYEVQMIRARTRAALKAKRARGERAGNVPYGFTADATGKLSPCAAERAVIAQVHALRAAGLSQRAIVAELARAGVVGRTGNGLALLQVQNILAVAA